MKCQHCDVEMIHIYGMSMASAKRCDRCGGYFDRNPSGYNYILLSNSYKIHSPIKSFDICPTCMKRFMQWTNGKAEIIPVVKEEESHE